MTSTRKLRRVESENQIWLVIPNHYVYKIELDNKILINLHHAMFFFCFIGRIFGGSQVRTEVRETKGEGIHWVVVHAFRDTLKGSGIGKGKGFRVGERVWKVKRERLSLWYAGIMTGMNCDTYDTIVLPRTRSHTSLYKGKGVSLLN